MKTKTILCVGLAAACIAAVAAGSTVAARAAGTAGAVGATPTAGRWLYGRVLWPDGTPVRYGTLYLAPDSIDDQYGRFFRTRTNGDGWYLAPVCRIYACYYLQAQIELPGLYNVDDCHTDLLQLPLSS